MGTRSVAGSLGPHRFQYPLVCQSVPHDLSNREAQRLRAFAIRLAARLAQHLASPFLDLATESGTANYYHFPIIAKLALAFRERENHIHVHKQEIPKWL